MKQKNEVFTPELGDRVQDSVTGFIGITTGRAVYLTGCEQFLVSPELKGGKAEEGRWFDEARLVVVDKRAFTLPRVAQAPGGPLVGYTPPPSR